MKLRIKGNFVRYRLTKSEVENFSKDGYLEESTNFLSGELKYVLKAKKGIDQLEVDYENNTITLYFPDAEKLTWFQTEKVGFKNSMSLPNGQEIGLLIEKDFVCLDDVEEDQSDNFPNPNAVC